jgi:hypothetical protein
MSWILYAAYALIALAVVVIADQARRAMGWLPAKEKPERIIGKRIVFAAVEGIGANSSSLPVGLIASYDHDCYKVEFSGPVRDDEQECNSAFISGRWVGVPISGAGRWLGAPVNGKLESGGQFIAMVKIASNQSLNVDAPKRRAH